MDLHLDLGGPQGGRARRARLERALRDAIRSGRLAPGSRLPATRALATDLGVSRGVVVEAYAQLAAEGYLLTARGGGTRVAHVADVADAALPTPAATSRPRFDLRPSLPAFDGFPRALWQAAHTRALRELPDDRLGYGDPRGEPELRAALAASLGRTRGVRTTADAVVITGGVRRGLPLVLELASRAGVTRAVAESPGWPRVPQAVRHARMPLAEVPVDADGLRVAGLGSGGGADLVLVTPAHQFPTGAVLSPQRRAGLVARARATGGLLFEDDYDAEYRYDRAPVGSLQGLAPDVVLHAGSASKLLGPAVRLGWLVLPPSLVPAELPVDPGAPSAVDQVAFADLLERGEVDRHLRRQRRRYTARRAALLAALAGAVPALMVEGAAAGLFCVLLLPDGTDEDAVVAACAERGLALEGGRASRPALVLGFANLHEDAAPAAVRELARVLSPRPRGAAGVSDPR